MTCDRRRRRLLVPCLLALVGCGRTPAVPQIEAVTLTAPHRPAAVVEGTPTATEPAPHSGEVLFAPTDLRPSPLPPPPPRPAATARPGSQSSDSGRRIVAVAPLHAAGKAEDVRLGEAVAEVLAVALADQQNLTVVERRKFADVLHEQKLTLAGLVDPATAARVGELLAADVVVTGSVVEAEGKLRLTAQAVAVEGRRVVGAAAADGARKDLDRLAVFLAGKVAPLIGVKWPEVKPDELDDSPVGRLHLMRGISFYHADNPNQAIAYCLRAVQLDPRLQEARLWIARAYLRLGEPAHARAELKRLAANPAAEPLLEQIRRLQAECDAKRKPG